MNFLSSIAPNQNNNSQEGIRTPKHKTIVLNTKHPQKVRIIPYLDKPFAFPYRVCWADLHTKDGTRTFPTMLTFSMNRDPKDKLQKVMNEIIHINYQIRQDHPNITNDTIDIQYKHPGRPHFPASLRPTYAVQVIPIVQDANGQDQMKMIQGSNIPEAHVMNIHRSVYDIIFDSINTDDPNELASWLNIKTKKPFPKDPTKAYMMRWINVVNSFPVYIHRDNKPSARYQVEPQPMDSLPALPKALYDKDKKGNYKYLDDPAWMYEPTRTRQPDFYKMALQEMEKRLDEYKESGQKNAYATGIKGIKQQAEQVKQNTQNENRSSETSSKSSQGASSGNDTFDASSLASDANNGSVTSSTNGSDPFSSQSNSASNSSSSQRNDGSSVSHDSSQNVSQSSSSKVSSSSSSGSALDTDALIKDVLK